MSLYFNIFIFTQSVPPVVIKCPTKRVDGEVWFLLTSLLVLEFLEPLEIYDSPWNFAETQRLPIINYEFYY